MRYNNKKRGKNIKIGLPSLHSRLHPKVMGILGLPCCTNSHRLVYYWDTAAVFFLRPWDLPKMVELGYLDVAFCGFDTIQELGVHVSMYQKFMGFKSLVGFCKRIDLESAKDKCLVVATEYPGMAREYLKQKYKDFKIIHIRGASEAYPHLDGISAIVDIIESGKTLKGNHLYLVEKIGYTCPCLIHHKTFDTTGNDLSVGHLAHLIGNAIKSDLMEIQNWMIWT